MQIGSEAPVLNILWSLLFFALLIAAVAALLGAVIHAVRTPNYAFVVAKSSKAFWLILIIIPILLLPTISVVAAIVYLTRIRPRLNATKDDSGAWPSRTSNEALPMTMNLPVAGWYPDPDSPLTFRWWNGNVWTESRSPTVPVLPPPGT